MKLSLSFRQEQVTIEQDGKEVPYTVREMTAADRDRYLDHLTKRMEVGPDGRLTQMKDVVGLQSELLGFCLHRDGQRVPVEEIQQWPASVVQALFDIAQDLNRLNASPPKNA
jgi:hypothetical protein